MESNLNTMLINKMLPACLVLSMAAAPICRAAVGVEPVEGELKKYVVNKGDTLLKIARRNNMPLSLLLKANGLSGGRVKPGRKLILPSLFILPRNPKDGIVLNVPERQVYLFEGGQMRAHYPVCVGRPESKWQTALGTFKIVEKKTNPVWKPTKSIVEAEGIKDEPVAAGAENPLGDRWMAWSKPGFGFHSTNAPQSIGLDVSHGCVRLYPESAHAMYDRVKEGMTIYAMYEPVKVGFRGGKYYLSVFPDIYKQGLTTIPHVQKVLAQYGLLPLVDAANLKHIVGEQAGVPRPLLGTDQKIKVNGALLTLPLAPMSAQNNWIVPAKELVTRLGGQMTPDGKDGVKITAKSHTLVLKEGQRKATLDNKPIMLAVPALRVKDILVAPLGPLAKVCGATIKHPNGQAIALTTKK